MILSGRGEARLAEVAADCGGALVLPFDVRDDDALARATQKAIGWKDGVDIAIANAGVSQRSRALKTDMQVYREIIEIDRTSRTFEKVASYDTSTTSPSGYAGCWGVYPMLGEDNVLASDIETGFYSLDLGALSLTTPSAATAE